MTETKKSNRAVRVESIESIDIVADDLLEVMGSEIVSGVGGKAIVILDAEKHSFGHVMTVDELKDTDADLAFNVRQILTDVGTVASRLKTDYIVDDEKVEIDAEINIA